MSLRIYDIAGLAGVMSLAACGAAPSAEGGHDAARGASPIQAVKDWVHGVADERPRIFCAIGAGASLAQDCRLETAEDAQGRILMLVRPDGGFRRVRVDANGELIAADGAMAARTARHGQAVAVLFGEERYAVPASALGSAAAP